MSVSALLNWEHTHREMLPSLIFQHEMQAKGITSTLHQVDNAVDDLPKNTVYFTPFYYDDFDLGRYHSQAALSSAWMVNLSYEQMHFRCGRSYLLPDGKFAHEQMIHCAWGERYKSLLKEHGVPEERIRLTGHPRFDIYKRPSLLFSRQELAQEYGLDPNKPWILVPYNFNISYITERQRESLKRRKYDLSDDFIQGVADARDAFTQMVRTLTDQFPEMEIILRVHPAGYESETVYKDEPRLGRNLHLIGGYDIANWITQAALVIVWNSTSSMEALIAGIPAISYEPHPFSARFDYDVNRILPTFSKLDDVLSVVRSLPDPELTYGWEIFEDWYKYREGNVARQVAIVQEAQTNFSRYATQVNLGTRVKIEARRAKDAIGGRHSQPNPKDKLAQVSQTDLQKAVDTLDVHHLKDVLR